MRLIYKNLKISNKQIDTINMATDIIIHDKKDNVGVVVIEKITPKQDCACWIMEDDSSTNIQSMDEIPLGHKIAMTDLNAVSYTHLTLPTIYSV